MTQTKTKTKTKLTVEEIEEAIRWNGLWWASCREYIEEEVRLAKRHPDRVRTRVGNDARILAWVEKRGL